MLRPSLSILSTIIVAFLATFGGNAGAQSWPTREPIYASRTADGGPLQPFTFSRQPAPALRRFESLTTRRVRNERSPFKAPTKSRKRGRLDSISPTRIRWSEEIAPFFETELLMRHQMRRIRSNTRSGRLTQFAGVPYVWGGGHGSFHDYGYDCSGTVSFALHYAGLLGQPIPSGDFLRYGQRGHGRWFTIYSRHGHVFAVIAGLRLDTTDLRYGGDVGPRWHLDGRDTWAFEARHPVGL